MNISVVECMEKQLLRVVFQPIVKLASAEIWGYEALTRGPIGTHVEFPGALFSQAEQEGCRVALERFVARLGIEAFVTRRQLGKLFLNLSAAAIVETDSDSCAVIGLLESMRFPPARLVIELTEQASPHPLPFLLSALRTLRKAGVRLALDDYGTGNTDLGRWVTLHPDYVKIDRSIIDGISRSSGQLAVLRHIQGMAKAGHAQLIAEGIEDADDLRVCYEEGIVYGQGFILGKPNEVLQTALPVDALNVIRDRGTVR